MYAATRDDGTVVWVVRQRDGTKRTFETEWEAWMSAQMTAVQEWDVSMRELIVLAREIVTRAQALSLLAQTNDITEAIQSVEPGHPLPGTATRREDAALRAALFDSMMVWLMEQAEGAPDGVTRMAVLFRRF